ncbi:TetR/AcrR family transcriptional regulator [Streptomyces sp. NBC_00582]|uniref:TetR/AcrR family transcriptional regulator n=1 Tax=Streptomyces sp. NBC_00582 TaxID=2975783 RepID=UPI002E8245E9|nr:helix-turn-helix domain-containing protein [Streptomyces sp. NBC_00582]WUB67481.1 TetR/AcrR family transcriptional regulator [Streptomyces sp. NBC_00582]
MTTDTERRLRADAARNAERILRTARAVFAELGPDAPLEEIARRADVRIRTLYNRFPNKADLVRAALDLAIAEDLTPAVERALADDDPLHGLVSLIEAAMGLAARELHTLAAARSAGTLTAEVYTPFYEALSLLARRAQDAGLLRADLVPDDLPRLMAMLTTTLWTMDPSTDGWRRYLTLMFEGLRPTMAKPLPSPVTLRMDSRTGNWSR